jgi:hypothetical protein
MFPLYGGNCFSSKAAYNLVEKLSEKRSKEEDVETEVLK